MPDVEWGDVHPSSSVLVSILVVQMGDRVVLFIPHEELLNMGYESLEDFAVVRCNGRYYELQGYSVPLDAWWVEEIELPQEVSDSGQSLESMGEGGSESPGRDQERSPGE